MRLLVTFLMAAVACVATEKGTVAELLRLHHARSPQFQEALVATLDAANIRKGTAIIGEGPDFFWAVEADNQPTLYVDDSPGLTMTRLNGNTWYRAGQLQPGTAHGFFYTINGERFGGRTDIPAFGPDSYEKPGVPRGKVTEKLVHTSKIYDGMQSDYWVYTPAAYDPSKPGALMVWLDGHNLAGPRAVSRADRLRQSDHREKDPGDGPRVHRSRQGRSESYAQHRIRHHGRSLRALSPRRNSGRGGAEVQPAQGRLQQRHFGSSSGGICSFNVAWRQPDQYSRVLSWVGSFTSIQWHPAEIDGGNVFPFMIRKQPKRNIRVWLQDGSEDLENNHGSWPLQNIQMANSLKMRGYDFHLSFGNGTHNSAQGNAELPRSLEWPWRDYDPAKTEQVYEMEAAGQAAISCEDL